MTAKCCQAFSEIMRGLKTLAKERDVPALALSQPDRRAISIWTPSTLLTQAVSSRRL
jgi:DnaB-like helicase C terminal domain